MFPTSSYLGFKDAMMPRELRPIFYQESVIKPVNLKFAFY